MRVKFLLEKGFEEVEKDYEYSLPLKFDRFLVVRGEYLDGIYITEDGDNFTYLFDATEFNLGFLLAMFEG